MSETKRIKLDDATVERLRGEMDAIPNLDDVAKLLMRCVTLSRNAERGAWDKVYALAGLGSSLEAAAAKKQVKIHWIAGELEIVDRDEWESAK